MYRAIAVASCCAWLSLPPAARAGDGDWMLETVRDPATWDPVAVLYQLSTETISGDYGTDEVRPRLEFRCVPGEDTAFTIRIDWQRFISSFNTEVRFSADDTDDITLTLGVDRTDEITLPRDPAENDRLLDYMRDRNSLEVSVTPYSAAPVTVTYKLSELAGALDRLAAACASPDNEGLSGRSFREGTIGGLTARTIGTLTMRNTRPNRPRHPSAGRP